MYLFLYMARVYLILINLLSFCLFGMDKKKAIRNAYRIPEKTLFRVTALGGSLGALLGMHLFHHKTRHTIFRIGVPALLILHSLLCILLFFWISIC